MVQYFASVHFERNLGGTKKYIIEEQSIEELFKKLTDKSLSLMFIEKNNEIFIDQLYDKAKEMNITRELISKIEFLKLMIKSNIEIKNRIKERMTVTQDPMELRKYELVLEVLEKDNKELMEKLKK